MRIAKLAVCGVYLVAASAFGRDAFASPGARLVYARSVDAATCPDENALRNAVSARLGYDPFFPWARQTIVVLVWRERGRYRARLQRVDEEGLAHGTRDLSSEQKTCAELFDAAALAISIAMDSLPKSDPPPTVAAEPPPEALTNPPPAPPPPAPPTALEAAAVVPPVAAASAPVHFVIGLDGLESIGVEPGPSTGLAAFVRARARAVSAGVELRADASRSASNENGPGRVDGRAYQLGLVPCAHVGEVSLCAVVSAGVLGADSTGVTNPRSASTVFVDVGPRVGVEWPLTRALWVRAHLDALVDLRRPTLEVSGVAAWEAPRIVGTLGAGFAVHFE
jgi:hypothetical protein